MPASLRPLPAPRISADLPRIRRWRSCARFPFRANYYKIRYRSTHGGAIVVSCERRNPRIRLLSIERRSRPLARPSRRQHSTGRHSSGEGMPTKGRLFAGCTVALVTPFRDGGLDEVALRRSVEWHVAQGTPILSPVGTTGEAPTLTPDEAERVIAIVVESAAGRAKVLAGTGSNATAEAIRLTRFAARAGVDGALLVTPYYNRPNQEGLYRHFAAIAECTDLPLV